MKDDYSSTTGGVTVSVRSFYLPEQSQPDDNAYVWGYRVRIANDGAETVQLLRRTWVITDARGRTQRVEGVGVVGQQPVLKPGASFEYTSGTPLGASSGFMTGAYQMQRVASGELFDVAIPSFSLDSPDRPTRLN